MSTAPRTSPGPALLRSPNRIIGILFGGAYLLVGMLGFFYSAGTPFAGPDPDGGNLILGIFEVNPLHNMAHLLIGAALFIAGVSSAAVSRLVNLTVGAAYLLLGFVGFFLAADHDSPLNFLSLNTPGHFLHLGSAIILLVVGLGADRSVRPAATTTAVA